jgi:hypothetical protein
VIAETFHYRGWTELVSDGARLRGGVQDHSLPAIQDPQICRIGRGELRGSPELHIVIISLPQPSWRLFAEFFRDEWSKCPIVVSPGQVINWPS